MDHCIAKPLEICHFVYFVCLYIRGRGNSLSGRAWDGLQSHKGDTTYKTYKLADFCGFQPINALQYYTKFCGFDITNARAAVPNVSCICLRGNSRRSSASNKCCNARLIAFVAPTLSLRYDAS